MNDWLKENLSADGKVCPCCNQFVKIYKRKINKSMAESLVLFYQKQIPNRETYFNLTQLREMDKRFISCLIGGGDFAQFAHWKIIESKPRSKGKDTRTSGYWRMTKKGIDFAEGKIHVPQHILLYNQTLLGFSDEMVLIRDCFKEPFRYSELMGFNNDNQYNQPRML